MDQFNQDTLQNGANTQQTTNPTNAETTTNNSTEQSDSTASSTDSAKGTSKSTDSNADSNPNLDNLATAVINSPSNFKLIVISLFLNAIVTVGLLYGYNKYYAPKFYETSLSKFINDQRILYLDGKLNIKQIQSNLKDFAQQLKDMPKNAVILDDSIVIKGAKPISYSKYTPELDNAKKDILEKYGAVGNLIIGGGENGIK